MAHCPPELLDDVADVVAEVRTWAGVIEKKPGVFYVRGQPFLHLHLLEGGRRWADVKGRPAGYGSTFRDPSPPQGDERSSACCGRATARARVVAQPARRLSP